MISTPRFSGGGTLMVIGYNYNSRNIPGLLLLRGLEVLNQLVPIYLVSLKFIPMLLLTPLFVLIC